MEQKSRQVECTFHHMECKFHVTEQRSYQQAASDDTSLLMRSYSEG